MGAIIAIAAFASALVAIPVVAIFGPKLLRPKTKIPGYDTRVVDCPYSLESVAKLLDDFLVEWRRTFLQLGTVKKAIGNLNITFVQKVSFKAGTLDVVGVTDKRDYIRIATEGRENVWRTALAHELVHVALWAMNGEPDPDHVGHEYGGWTEEHNKLVERVRAMHR